MYIRIIFIAFTMSLMTSFAQAQLLEQSSVENVSAQEFLKLVEAGEGQLIDIRTPKEYAMGHITGAQMIDYYAPDFKTNLSKLDKETPIYIYCRSGNRTSRTVSMLQQLGFKQIVNLQRGLNDWQNSGYALVTD